LSQQEFLVSLSKINYCDHVSALGGVVGHEFDDVPQLTMNRARQVQCQPATKRVEPFYLPANLGKVAKLHSRDHKSVGFDILAPRCVAVPRVPQCG